MNDENVIALTNENGDEELFEVLFTFHSDDYNKDYILVYPEGADFAEDNVDIFPFVVTEEGEAGVLDVIEDDAELAMVEAALDQFIEENDN